MSNSLPSLQNYRQSLRAKLADMRRLTAARLPGSTPESAAPMSMNSPRSSLCYRQSERAPQLDMIGSIGDIDNLYPPYAPRKHEQPSDEFSALSPSASHLRSSHGQHERCALRRERTAEYP
jgi:hypothetical protein